MMKIEVCQESKIENSRVNGVTGEQDIRFDMRL